jgi:hypothetical protein
VFDLFKEPEAPAPVVPKDLHLVKAVSADSAGNVECLYCQKPVPYAEAEAIGSEGLACVSCYVSAVPRLDAMANKQLRRESRQRLKLGFLVLLAMVAYFVFRIWIADAALKRDEPTFEPVFEFDVE